MDKPNRIIVPPNYAVQVTLKFDPVTGATEMAVRNTGLKQVSMLQIAALLAEHNASLMRSLVTGTLKVEAAPKETTNGGDPNAA